MGTKGEAGWEELELIYIYTCVCVYTHTHTTDTMYKIIIPTVWQRERYSVL